MIRQIDEREYKGLIGPILVRLFGTENPDIFAFPFNRHFDDSLVLFEYPGSPSQSLFNALMIVSMKLNEKDCYLTFPEPHPLGTQVPYHWLVPYEDISTYEKVVPVDKLDYIFLSPKGSWSLIPSDELFAVLSGNQDLMKDVKSMLPELKDGALGALLYWKEVKIRHGVRVNLSWVDELILNVYGESTSKMLLSESGWRE